jgi:5,10-methylene-tetrahydrofolate dehydrogenase/methenyl tetrahydrofolate cyclohydrolase
VGAPLSDALASGGFDVDRIDVTSEKLKARLKTADIIISATGQPGLITSDMVLSGAIVIDVGSPLSELSQEVLDRNDITRSPNPGGVGPMTVAALFDNLLIAAGA